ncbi:MAG TPA: stage II sporulation protein P [Bacillus sp. (in: firmicutes)]|uniref:stage II sporulation protein P n=1 Tax=Bacillus litorisediminis TaxID=2922713 RepID=UPI001FADFBAE|nr:stage II sporulation protein P [Bacillus litorisediminis]HWO77706.1 stage II sporulation protein P [Bacillus sp. (in: firmicutes)]
MKPYRRQSPFITIEGIHIVKAVGIFISVMFLLFSVSGIITKLNDSFRLSSLNVHNAVAELDIEMLYAIMGTENRYFLEGLPKNEQKISLAKPLLAMATNIEFDDPTSFLGRELPGLYAFHQKVIAPRDGSDYTDMPIESTPPIKKIEKDVPVKNTEDIDPAPADEDTAPPPEQSTGEKDVVYIYFTHNRESFLPHLEGVTDPDLAQHSEVNVTKVGDRLKEELEQRGIGTAVDKTDFIGKIINDGLDYSVAYDLSRPVVQDALAANRDVSYVMDIHRDSQPREKTTIEINGKSYAKIMFVYGRENPDFEKNKKIAEDLHKRLNEAYPGISRKVVSKAGTGVDGVYNQDLHGNALLIEIGGYENNFEELYNTAEAFAEVFSEYYWQAEAVNADEETDKTQQ